MLLPATLGTAGGGAFTPNGTVAVLGAPVATVDDEVMIFGITDAAALACATSDAVFVCVRIHG